MKLLHWLFPRWRLNRPQSRLYLVMASLIMGAVMLIAGNLIADLLLKVADPRIRLENLN